jgi:diguanylate cyclase (GGDEF)-like protein
MLKNRLLSEYAPENFFYQKKAEMLLIMNLIFLFLHLFVSIPVHLSDFHTNIFLFIGDLILSAGMIVSILILKRGKLVLAGTVTIISLQAIPLVHNAIGDFFSKGDVDASRFLESLVVFCFFFPVIMSFTVKKSQFVMAILLTSSSIVIHFMVLKFVCGVEVPFSFLLYLIIAVMLGAMGLINTRFMNEALDSLIESKARVSELNSQLEQTVKMRTKELKESNRKLEALSTTDALTCIANRRKFDIAYRAEWNRAGRTHSPLAVIIIDLDHFKLYNDSFGHQQGDVCLKSVARKLDYIVKRSGELVARYGGEEFVAILPGVDTERALEVAERIRLEIEAMEIRQAPGAKYEFITVSIGVSARHFLPEDAPELYFREADQALYNAKKNGRNRVMLAKTGES